MGPEFRPLDEKEAGEACRTDQNVSRRANWIWRSRAAVPVMVPAVPEVEPELVKTAAVGGAKFA